MKDYSAYMQKAFLGVVYDILSDVSNKGLTDGAFYMITFETPEATIPDFIRAKYPQEMTIVLQNQFDNLIVDKDKFSVDLSFGGITSTVVIPFSSLKSFADPDAQFGFHLTPSKKSTSVEKSSGAEVIDLASRRKK